MTVTSVGHSGGEDEKKRPPRGESLDEKPSVEDEKMSAQEVADGFIGKLEREVSGATARLEPLKEKEKAAQILKILEDSRRHIDEILHSGATDKQKIGLIQARFSEGAQLMDDVEMGRKKIEVPSDQAQEPTQAREKMTEETPEIGTPEKAAGAPAVTADKKDQGPDKLEQLVSQFKTSDPVEKSEIPNSIARAFIEELNKKAGGVIEELKAQNKDAELQKKVATAVGRAKEEIFHTVNSDMSAQEKLDKLQDIKLNASVEISRLKLEASFGEENSVEEEEKSAEEPAERIAEDHASEEDVIEAEPEVIPDGVYEAKRGEEEVKAPKQSRVKSFMKGAGVGAAVAAAGLVGMNAGTIVTGVGKMMHKGKAEPAQPADSLEAEPDSFGIGTAETAPVMERDAFYRIFNSMADEKLSDADKATVDKFRDENPEAYMTLMDRYIADTFHTDDGIDAHELENIKNDRYIPDADRSRFLEQQFEMGKIYKDENGEYTTESPEYQELKQWDNMPAVEPEPAQATSPEGVESSSPEAKMVDSAIKETSPDIKKEPQFEPTLENYFDAKKKLAYSKDVFANAKEHQQMQELYTAVFAKNNREEVKDFIADFAKDAGFHDGNKSEIFAATLGSHGSYAGLPQNGDRGITFLTQAMDTFNAHIVYTMSGLKTKENGYWHIVRLRPGEYALIQKAQTGSLRKKTIYFVDTDGDQESNGTLDGDDVLKDAFDNGLKF